MIERIKSQKWEKIFTRPFSVQRQEGPILQAAKLGLRDILIVPTEKKGVYNWYSVLDQIKELGQNVEKLFLNKEKFDEHIIAHRGGTKKIIKLFNVDISARTKNGLGDIYKKFMKIFKGDFSIPYAVPFGLDGYFVPRVKEMLRSEIGEKIDEKWNIIEQQTELLEIQRIQIEVSRLKLEKKLEFEMARLLKKYSWLTIYDFYDKAADAEFIQSLVLGKADEETKKKIEELEGDIIKNKEKFQILLDSVNNKLLKQGILALNFYVIFRSERMDNLRKILVAIKPFYMKLTNLLRESNPQWTFDDIVNLTERETERLLIEDKTPDSQSVKSRSTLESYHYYADGNYNSMNKFGKEINALLEKDLSEVSKLKGNIAFKGLVKGTVKIIHNVDDLKKVNEGDILVTSMTKPDYVTAMKKAGAIVTDEGGITCHAAITARELQKPCIIATKISTRILKDGDEVEVDATKGLIKIISRD